VHKGDALGRPRDPGKLTVVSLNMAGETQVTEILLP
jgi:hypothetical protein